MFFGFIDFLQKTNEQIRLHYYDTSGWLVFLRFLDEIEDTKKHFEINWPLLIQKYFFVLQRISLARALYAVLNDQKTEKAEFVVLLDDPLSAVDPSVS